MKFIGRAFGPEEQLVQRLQMEKKSLIYSRNRKRAKRLDQSGTGQ